MLKMHVQSEAVRRNIELFKQIARKFTQKRHPNNCAAVVNRVTGAMRFSEMAGLNPSEWKHIEIDIDLDGHDMKVFEEGGKKEAFECKDLEPLAYRIMSETLHVLQIIIAQAKNLNDLSHLEFEPSMGPVISRDIVHEAWHQLDRIQAETMLKEHATGAYFFRKDRYASVLEQELTLSHRKLVKCLTLTFVDPEKVVRDRTIVKCNDRWMFYDDDPTLSMQSYDTIGELLASMGTILRQPLLA
jgi:hypothetical protein